MYHGDDWKEILAEEIESYSTQFQHISDTIKDNWRDLHENRVTNAYRALPIFLDNQWNNTDKDLLKETISYLNRNFDYFYKHVYPHFKVITVSSSNVYYHSPDLFYYSKGDNRSVVVGQGLKSEWSKYNCDKDNESKMMKLTCFKIGDSKISYHGDSVEFINSSN